MPTKKKIQKQEEKNEKQQEIGTTFKWITTRWWDQRSKCCRTQPVFMMFSSILSFPFPCCLGVIFYVFRYLYLPTTKNFLNIYKAFFYLFSLFRSIFCFFFYFKFLWWYCWMYIWHIFSLFNAHALKLNPFLMLLNTLFSCWYLTYTNSTLLK